MKKEKERLDREAQGGYKADVGGEGERGEKKRKREED